MSPPFRTFYKEILNSSASAWTWLWLLSWSAPMFLFCLGTFFCRGAVKRGSAWPLWSGVSRPLYSGRIQPLKLRSAKSEICAVFLARQRWWVDSIIIRKKGWHWLIDFTTHIYKFICFNILILIGTFNCYSWVPPKSEFPAV